MPSTRLTVVRSGLPLPAAAPDETVVSDADVRQWALDGRLLGRLRRYGSARLLTERLSTAGRPMLMWALWLMARRSSIADSSGRERPIGLSELLRWSRQLGAEVAQRPRLLRSVEHELEALAAAAPVSALPLRRDSVLLYLRTDVSFGVRAGGSVGHIVGVLNELARDGWSPVLLTTTAVPTLAPSIETHVVDAPESFWNFAELPALVFGRAFEEQARRVLAGRSVSLVYQRYSLNSYAGLKLARALRVPFVLEYNGSEIWMSRHWSRALTHEALANRIEMLNVTRADLVVVVSRAMRDELVARGVPAGQILVNPNGVDPRRYTPAIDGSAVRRRLDLEGATVIGFISTFQPWHGAGILAQAFARFVAGRPAQRDQLRLLMIGTGPELERTRQMVAAVGIDACVRFTGLIEQADGPEYLAACDVLASPHVPNPDGSPFFGSPTKLFEYMAMGKAIVASNLDQIGDVLRHGETAWLVPPADPGALAAGIERLVDDPAFRRALGDAARRDAVAHHTWRAHVERIVATLSSRLGVPAA